MSAGANKLITSTEEELGKLKVADLKEELSRRHVPFTSRLKKQDLLNLLASGR